MPERLIIYGLGTPVIPSQPRIFSGRITRKYRRHLPKPAYSRYWTHEGATHRINLKINLLGIMPIRRNPSDRSGPMFSGKIWGGGRKNAVKRSAEKV
jgi:hypothetical protein